MTHLSRTDHRVDNGFDRDASRGCECHLCCRAVGSYRWTCASATGFESGSKTVPVRDRESVCGSKRKSRNARTDTTPFTVARTLREEVCLAAGQQENGCTIEPSNSRIPPGFHLPEPGPHCSLYENADGAPLNRRNFPLHR